MTVTQLLAEICSRAGEGYQNYTDRAAAAFKAAVLTMLYSSLNPEIDAPALYKVGTTLATSESSSILLSGLLTAAGLDEGSIDTLRYGIDNNATYLDVANDITYMARSSGTVGNLIGVEYILPSAINSPLSFSVTGDLTTGLTIRVNLSTNGAGVSNTDTERMVAALAISEANFYVSATWNSIGGAGTVLAMAKQMLTGGTGSGEYQRMERITKQQQEIARLNPSLLNSKDNVSYYFLSGFGNAAQITLLLPPPFNMNGNIEYSIIGWTDAIITPTIDGLGVDTTDLSTAFSPVFMENAIATASALLLKEIMV